MKKPNHFSSIILFIFIAFSCSDDGGIISTDQEYDEANASLSTFNEFLKIKGLTFTKGGGLNFASNDWCPSTYTAEINGDKFNLQTLGCYRPLPDYRINTYFMSNVVEGFDRRYTAFLNIRFVSQELYNDPPPTGPFQVVTECYFYCYRNVILTLYLVDSDGEVMSQYDGYTEQVYVENEHGKVSVSFDALFFPYDPYDSDYYTISATVSCCN